MAGNRNHARAGSAGRACKAVVMSKGEGHSSPSPLSQEGQFPLFTGEPLSGTGRPHCDCPAGGAWPFPTPERAAGRSRPKATLTEIVAAASARCRLDFCA